MIDLRHGNCLEIMKDIPDNSIDLKSKKLNAKTVEYKKKYKVLKNKLDKIEKILYEED